MTNLYSSYIFSNTTFKGEKKKIFFYISSFPFSTVVVSQLV